MSNLTAHPLSRSGIAARADLDTPECRELLRILEREQEQFLLRENAFRSPEYQWPRDALHTWSRVWEYPYVYFHLQQRLAKQRVDSRLLVVDVGTGVTFFPFAVANLGFDVICTDIDPICVRDLRRAVEVIAPSVGRVKVQQIERGVLPIGDAQADVVTCISVLEHIPDFQRTIAEMGRVIKPGGLLLLTIDLDLRGDSEIGPGKHRELIQWLDSQFLPACADTTVHPGDLLTTTNSLYPIQIRSGMRRYKFQMKQKLRACIGRQPSPLVSKMLTVQGLVLSRKSV